MSFPWRRTIIVVLVCWAIGALSRYVSFFFGSASDDQKFTINGKADKRIKPAGSRRD